MQFIFRVYSISLVAVTIVGALRGDLDQGMLWMSEPGTYKEFLDNVPMAERTWSVPGKIVVLSLFSSTGFFALSICSAITKNFGALTMSVTSTARKATTLFLSFFLFKDNVFTAGHLVGIVVFVTSLLGKAVLRRDNDRRKQGQLKRKFSGIDLGRSETNGNGGGGGTQQVHGSCDNTNGQHNHNHNSTSTQAAAATSSGGGKENKDHLTLRHGAAAGP